jgi:hypothetical protein
LSGRFPWVPGLVSYPLGHKRDAVSVAVFQSTETQETVKDPAGNLRN